MTEDQKQQRTNLIPRPIQRAFYAGLSAGGLSVVFGVPLEYVPRIALIGVCYSTIQSWRELGPRKHSRRSGRRKVLVNGRPVNLEFSVSQGSYITRETWGDTFNRWIFGKKQVSPVRPIQNVKRPDELLDEFTFVSRGLQLRESDVRRWLRSAWRNRDHGRGLSERRWVREFSQRPTWYKELGTDWYYAMMRLLLDCQSGLHFQMVIIGSNQWASLANEPFMTMRLLKWYESERRKK